MINPQPLDLAELTEIANAEPTHKWGFWNWEPSDWDGHAVFVGDTGPGVSYVAARINQGHDEGEATARYIATFDPPTMQAMLARLQAAEAKLAAMVAVAKELRDTPPEPETIGYALHMINGARAAAKDILKAADDAS